MYVWVCETVAIWQHILQNKQINCFHQNYKPPYSKLLLIKNNPQNKRVKYIRSRAFNRKISLDQNLIPHKGIQRNISYELTQLLTTQSDVGIKTCYRQLLYAYD